MVTRHNFAPCPAHALRFLSLFICFFFTILASWAKANDDPNLATVMKDDLRFTITSPDILGLWGGLSVSSMALTNEEPRLNSLWAGEEGAADQIFELGDAGGNAIYPIVSGLVLHMAGKVGLPPRWRTFGDDLLRVQAVNALATVTMKRTVDRRRPSGGRHSFPSGHTSTAFATAAAVYHNFGPKWGSVAFAAGTYIGLSRVQENKHYISDVVAGAVLATYISLRVLHRKPMDSSVRISPFVGSSKGFRLSLSF